MALPKRKQSKARSRKRRTHWKTKEATISSCSQCNQPKMPHRACPNCGYYRGRPVTTPTS
ncbi:MAG TPA: 50S ribosomal protein L32 [Candidatus Marinimicrobia bacterium]|nr:50S ribosomal protein L32 [Candidatus Neomarinimicrobiota bacterium]